MMSDLDFVVSTAVEAGVSVICYTTSSMVAHGRYTLLFAPNETPLVMCNPASAAAMIGVMTAAGIACNPLPKPNSRFGERSIGCEAVG